LEGDSEQAKKCEDGRDEDGEEALVEAFFEDGIGGVLGVDVADGVLGLFIIVYYFIFGGAGAFARGDEGVLSGVIGFAVPGVLVIDVEGI
jgi:hypothetical protein